jgi:hypothetical protein
VILSESPQAAGITGALSAAGMDPDQVHTWFHRRRSELSGVSPALVLMTRGPVPARLVLALAQADALALSETGEITGTWPGSGVPWRIPAAAGDGPVMPKHAWEGSQ